MKHDTLALGMMDLRRIVERYAALASGFGEPVPLEKFGLDKQETEKVFSGLDEDYHISRFLHFSRAEGQVYEVNGEGVTHLVLDRAISSIL